MITLNGDSGITTPTYGGADTSEYLVPVTGFKNRIINGAMMIDQRNAGASHTLFTGGLQYGVDRFFTFCSGANLTGQRITGTNTGTAYTYKITGATGSTSVNYGQRIENLNVLDLNSQVVTVSLKLYASAAISNVTITLFYCSGVNTGYGTTAASQSITVASGLNSYAVSFTLPSTASNGFESAVTFGSGIGNGVSVEISQFQLEKGSTATSFDYRPYGTELALCQRYYVDLANNGGATQNIWRAIGFAATYTTTQGTYVVQVPVPMRTLPSLSQSGTMYLQNLGATSVSSFGGPYSMAGTVIEGDFTMVGAVTANTTAILRWNNSSTQKFAYSAEL